MRWNKALSMVKYQRNMVLNKLKVRHSYLTCFVEFNFDEFNDKKYKADYLSLQIKFFDQLKYLSIKLKNIALTERVAHLKKKLGETNEWIKT